MSRSLAVIEEAFRKVLRLSEQMDYGSVVVHFQFRKGKIATSRVAQETTMLHGEEIDSHPVDDKS